MEKKIHKTASANFVQGNTRGAGVVGRCIDSQGVYFRPFPPEPDIFSDRRLSANTCLAGSGENWFSYFI